MGWGSIRQEKWDDENGICEWCKKPIKSISESCLHHKINRCQRSKGNTYDNAELRHHHCEREAHQRYPYGNREGNLRRQRDEKVRQTKSRVTRQPVVAQARQPHQAERVGRVYILLEWNPDTSTFSQCGQFTTLPTVSEPLEERLQRLESMLLPTSRQ